MEMRTLLLALLVAFGFTAQAATAPPDSIGVERKGKKNIVLYKVEAGETLFGITRKYRTTVAEVQKLNAGLAGGVKVGQIIKVPALSNDAPSATTAVAPLGAAVEKMHIVTRGQTLFAIARQYKVSVADLNKWNNLASNGLVEGQQLKVSPPHDFEETTPAKIAKERSAQNVDTDAKEAEVKQPVDEPKLAPIAKVATAPEHRPGYVRHTVKTGETLYAIARTYNAKVDQIKTENNLGTGGVNVGQVLDIKKGAPMDEAVVAATPAAPVEERVAETKGEPVDTATKPTPTLTTPAGGYERVVEHGVAELVDNDAGSRNYFCLHRTAAVGKILQVTNEMNGAKVFVRVIGKLPETGNNDKVSIKISRKAFEALAAPDKRFPVEISYPNP